MHNLCRLVKNSKARPIYRVSLKSLGECKMEHLVVRQRTSFSSSFFSVVGGKPREV
jgi:hypothetical protein